MRENTMQRRRYLSYAGAASVGALAGCAGGGDGSTPTPRVERETVIRERTVVRESTATPEDLVELHVLVAEAEVTTMMWLYGISHGAWRRHGIDLSVEVAAFGKYSRALTAGLTKVSGGVSLPTVLRFINEGEDIVIYGVRLNFYNEMLTKSGSGITDLPGDLRDARLGVPFETSTTTNAYRAIFLDEYGFDILTDTGQTTSAAPPVLWNLLMEDELDVIIEFDAFTVRAHTTDEVRTLFDPYRYWFDAGHDYPPPVAVFAAYREWLEENAQITLDYLAGWEDAVRLSTENIDEAIRNYGRLGSLTTEAEGEVVKAWMDEGRIIGGFDYTQAYADDNWAFVEMLHRADAFETLPTKEDVIVTHDTLREWAGG